MNKIDKLRQELAKLIDKHKELTHPAVVKKSQELDKLILEAQRRLNNG